MAARRRLDAELVRRRLARSRGHAAELIAAGKVKVKGLPAQKPATNIDPADPIVVADVSDEPVSRGAYKLTGALQAFAALGVEVSGRRCLDAGASTGGFTEVLLRHDAREVVAVDVGYGQLAWSLRNDSRVLVRERTNIRHLSAAEIDGEVDVTVADLSFISLCTVLPALTSCTASSGVIVPMVKPQFEVGRDRIGPRGVVRDPAARADAVLDVMAAAAAHGWGTVGVTPSPAPGPSGNLEFFCAMTHGAVSIGADEVREVVAEFSRQRQEEPG